MSWEMLSPRYISYWVYLWYQIGPWFVVLNLWASLGGALILLIFHRDRGKHLRGWKNFLVQKRRDGKFLRRLFRWAIVPIIINGFYYFVVLVPLRNNPDSLAVSNQLQSLSTADFREAVQLINMTAYWGWLLVAFNLVCGIKLLSAALPLRPPREASDRGTTVGRLVLAVIDKNVSDGLVLMPISPPQWLTFDGVQSNENDSSIAFSIIKERDGPIQITCHQDGVKVHYFQAGNPVDLEKGNPVDLKQGCAQIKWRSRNKLYILAEV